ncbi:hypothetical protein DFP74_1523 [Nocardiopsis sp. Huas11]|uniref:hypothetical protein n=1 Tax=Nocardiopsis sp. Huas11 TaxID=2183912 RepID=UPI000F1F4BB0|nr:hypothetical protein [Nocardiopsis sp. Huas11]RKS05907.1 hypothetical protein DFP74_1523 [Nocardiopsis sp. Huas11]
MDRTEESQGRWVVHGERTLYDNPWVRFSKADITTPSGRRFEHHAVTLPSAAVIAILSRVLGTAGHFRIDHITLCALWQRNANFGDAAAP